MSVWRSRVTRTGRGRVGRRAWKCRTPKSRPRDLLCVWEPGGASLLISHSPGPALLVSPCAGCSYPCSSGVVMRPPLFTAWTDSWLPRAHSLFLRVQPGLPAHHPMELDSDPDSLGRARVGGSSGSVGRGLSLLPSPQPRTGLSSVKGLGGLRKQRGSVLFPRSNSCRGDTSGVGSRNLGAPFSF